MIRPLLTVIVFCISNYCALAQITSDDIIITTKGLSEEYASRFKEASKKDIIVSVLNEYEIPENIAPIKITVSYEKGEGEVTAEINYDQEKIFASNSTYRSNNRTIGSLAKGIVVILQHQIFSALGQYKKEVATKNYLMDKELLNFGSTLKLKKQNGDWAIFYAYNRLNYQGFYPSTFYNNVRMSIAGKLYETETSNPSMLNDMKYFAVGKIVGLDGNKTGAYYFCKFFNIETN